MKYNTLSDYLKNKYGCKVYKLSLQSGCTCPNRDGTKGYGGCKFCSEGGSGDFAARLSDIDTQIKEAKEKIDSKFPKGTKEENKKYIAYFQSFTNTYGDEERLQKLYKSILSYPEIVAISIGTRPDCISDNMLCFLKELNKHIDVWIELGFQSANDNTIRNMNIGYDRSVFEDTYKRLKDAGITVIVHVILGLPGECKEDMLYTIKYLAGLNPHIDGIKLQLLHVLKNTKLYEEYMESLEKNEDYLHVLTLDEYCKIVTKCLMLLPSDTVVHRITGDGPKSLLVEPKWSADKKNVLNKMRSYISDVQKFRVHHIMCTNLYRGMGYDGDFAKNMTKIVRELRNNPDKKLYLVNDPDCICERCPNLKDGKFCTNGDNNVRTKDTLLADALDLEIGEIYTYRELMAIAKVKLTRDVFENSCKNCNWYKQGACRYEDFKFDN